MNLPVPTLDHVVVNMRDAMNDGAALYRRLGFQLTERGRHTLGTINHLAIFGTDYLELIAVEPDAQAVGNDVRRFPFGLNGLVFGTDDAAALHETLRGAGVPVDTPVSFSRPVDLSGGRQDAKFTVLRLTEGAVPSGRVYFCQHFTRQLVWRPEWQSHPNGVTGVARAVIAAVDPAKSAALFGRMFGAASLRPIEGGLGLTVGASRFEFVTPAALARDFGAAAPDAAGRAEYMAALGFRTASVDQAAGALAAGGLRATRPDPRRLVVAAADTMGTALEFVA